MSKSSIIIDYESLPEENENIEDLKESIKSIIELQKQDEEEIEEYQSPESVIGSEHSNKISDVTETIEDQEQTGLSSLSRHSNKDSDVIEIPENQEQSASRIVSENFSKRSENQNEDILVTNSVTSGKSIHSTETLKGSVHDDSGNDENLSRSSKHSNQTAIAQKSCSIPRAINIRPLFGNRCTCDSPEKIPCAICYMKCQPCHCHPNARYQDQNNDLIYVFSNFIFVMYSIIMFIVMWSFNFWLCVGYALWRGIKLFFQKDFETQIIIVVLMLSLFMTILLHVKFLTFKNRNNSIKSEIKSETLNQDPPIHVPGHRAVIIPGTNVLSKYYNWYSSSSNQPLKIEIREDHICSLKPREQTFTLTLLNERMERVYNATTKIVIPQCGAKPILVVTPNSFELSRY